MASIKFTGDPIVKRLRWVMVGTIIFSMFNTLAGQPERFWSNPQKAIRGDGLGIHNHLNHTFEFFLSYGWPPYVLSCMAYLAVVFVVVSVLPGRAALIAAFSFIFGHYFGGCNWLAGRWHLGFTGVTYYSVALSVAVAFSLFPVSGHLSNSMVRRLRWVLVGVFLVDFLLTMLGQPSAYWQHPEMVHEGNSMLRWFMLRGWVAFVLMDFVYCLGLFLLASFLPRFSAMMVIFGYVFGYFDGASNWLFYEWRMGMEAPVIYGVILSVIIVRLAFPKAGKTQLSQKYFLSDLASCCNAG